MLLIDGDVLLYKLGYACNNETLSAAIFGIDNYLDNLRSQLPVKYFEEPPTIYVGDGKPTFRHKLATIKVYKGARTPEKPIHFYKLKEHLLHKHSAIECSYYEVDDYLGFNSRKNNAVMCSIDKDIGTLPGLHYHLDRRKLYRVGSLGVLKLEQMRTTKVLRGSGIKFFWAQMLMGDRADNIPGIAGYGSVETYNTLAHINDPIELGSTVYAIYLRTFGGSCAKMFIEMGDLLWILREPAEFFHTQGFLKEIMRNI